MFVAFMPPQILFLVMMCALVFYFADRIRLKFNFVLNSNWFVNRKNIWKFQRKSYFSTQFVNRKSFVKFCLFGKSFGCDFSRFSKLLDFSKSCLPKSSAMINFKKIEFSDAISEKSARLRFSDIHNPSLRFLHRWMSFMLFPMVELCFVTTPKLKCLFAMVNRIKYTPIADIVNYFKNLHKMSRPIECTSMITQIVLNLGCPKMAKLAYIEGDVPNLGLDYFVHAHILHEEPDHSLSMLYGRKAIRLPNPGLRLYSCESPPL
jgi:hypothetical protein